MKYLKIQNAGELDIRLVALMGGTTKKNDRYKIGRFGTGLKYTIAFLFRNNLSFKIFSGENPVDVSLEIENINNDVFEIICINKHRTSITTNMGLEWSAWMILRELWCNALDEGSHSREIEYSDEPADLTGESGKTTFYIQINDEINNVLENWGNYFIQNQDPMFQNDSYAIYENDDIGHLKLYKQGVLIYQNPDQKSLFRYDIKKAEINELREFKGMVSLEVFEALRNPNTEVVSYFLANIKETHFEGTQLDYDWFSSFCEIWKTTIGENKVSYYSGGGGSGEKVSNEAADNMAGVIKLPKKIYTALTKAFEGIGAIGLSDRREEFFEVKNTFVSDKINDMLSRLIDCGYEYDLEIKFITGVFSEKIYSGTRRKQNTVLISNTVLDMEDVKFAAELIDKIERLKMTDDNSARHFLHLYADSLLKKIIA